MHIVTDLGALRSASGLKLLVGMPLEVFIECEQRTSLQYLVKPLSLVLYRVTKERQKRATVRVRL